MDNIEDTNRERNEKSASKLHCQQNKAANDCTLHLPRYLHVVARLWCLLSTSTWHHARTMIDNIDIVELYLIQQSCTSLVRVQLSSYSSIV